MKVLTFLLAAMLLLTSATCKKQSSETSFKGHLIGKWKFTGSTGGFAGKSIPADHSASKIIEFKTGGRYVKYVNGEPDMQGNYDIVTIKSIYSGVNENAIRFDPSVNDQKAAYVATITGDELMLADNFYDGFTNGYERVK